MADDSLARAQTSETAISASPTHGEHTPNPSRDNAHNDNADRQAAGLDTGISGHDDLQDILSPIAVHADAEWTAQDEFENHASTPAIDVPPATGQHGAEADSDNGCYLESRYVEESPLEEFMRNRRPSISFDPKVKLETGHEHILETPLPKLAINTRLRRESILQELSKPTRRSPLSRTYGEADGGAFDAVTGEPTRPLTKQNHSLTRIRPPQNRSRYPLLHSTVNSLPSEKDPFELETGSSLNSNSTASTSLSEVRTPTDGNIDCLVFPISTYSPFHHPVSLEESSAWPKPHRQPSSSRAKSYTFDRKLSLRSTTRFRRSTSSSISPATAFLSKFAPREEPPPELDSEGQEVGDYVLGRQVGFGGFSIVREAYTLEGDERVQRAVKIVRRVVAGKSEQENDQFQVEFEREVALWRCLGHRHILPLIAVYVTPVATFCFTKLNTGGTLFDLVRSNRNGLRQDLARRYAYQLASAIRYLHEDMRIVHRDIKLENCLLDLSAPGAESEGGNLLLCDFGLAEFTTRTPRRSTPSASADTTPYGTPPPHSPGPSPGMRHHIGPSETSTSIAGSLQYAAPELIMSPAGLLSTAVDIWAFGVVIYALMVGDLPFQHMCQPGVLMIILAGEWDLQALRGAEGVVREGREDEVEEVVGGCLEMSSEERWTVGRVLGCAWLEGCQEVVEEAGGWKL